MKVHTEQAVMVISRVDWERGGERGKDVDKGGLWLMSMTSMCLSIKGKPHSLVFICRTKEGQRLGGGGDDARWAWLSCSMWHPPLSAFSLGQENGRFEGS